MKVLGIESSCDETGIALYDSEVGLLSHVLHSQVSEHEAFGGVVPEIASRDHIRKWVGLTRKCLADAGADVEQIDAVAYTAGPGLAGALFTGAVAGRTLAWALSRPAIGVHHMEAHLLAPLLDDDAPQMPFICLLVSGGHTQLMRMDAVGQYKLLGDTLDDAAGEAFDKTAKLLGLGYPGGPRLAAAAEGGDEKKFPFARPMTNRPGLDFSFSGLKTAAMTAFLAADRDSSVVADIAASFEVAVVDTLIIKCLRAMKAEGISQLVVAGGVASNKKLRTRLLQAVQDIGGRLTCPRFEFCTDNGAMIAYAGALRLAAGERTGAAITVRPRWPLTQLSTPA